MIENETLQSNLVNKTDSISNQNILDVTLNDICNSIRKDFNFNKSDTDINFGKLVFL